MTAQLRSVFTSTGLLLLLLLLFVFISTVSCSHKLALMLAPVPRQHHQSKWNDVCSRKTAKSAGPLSQNTPVWKSTSEELLFTRGAESVLVPFQGGTVPACTARDWVALFLFCVSLLPNSGQWFSWDIWFLLTGCDWYGSFQGQYNNSNFRD